jgi:hypothetical protein
MSHKSDVVKSAPPVEAWQAARPDPVDQKWLLTAYYGSGMNPRIAALNTGRRTAARARKGHDVTTVDGGKPQGYSFKSSERTG